MTAKTAVKNAREGIEKARHLAGFSPYLDTKVIKSLRIYGLNSYKPRFHAGLRLTEKEKWYIVGIVQKPTYTIFITGRYCVRSTEAMIPTGTLLLTRVITTDV